MHQRFDKNNMEMNKKRFEEQTRTVLGNKNAKKTGA